MQYQFIDTATTIYHGLYKPTCAKGQSSPKCFN